MGFGSYDESEQEQPSEEEDDGSEGVEKHDLDAEYHGDDGIDDDDVDDMLGHL